jgi:hypothetical protein
MPLELGFFMGAKVFGGVQQRRKVALVLERTKYAYQNLVVKWLKAEREKLIASPM